MLFKRAVLEGIARGEITLAFRRWKKPGVKTGTRLRTALGEVRIGDVRAVAESSLGEADARRAGFASLAALKRNLPTGAERTLYRVEITGIDADRRLALQRKDAMEESEAAALEARFARWDTAAGKSGYHRAILSAIEAAPATAAVRLAEELDVDKPRFKRDVRKLKEHGLTESLETGYRLSPRGAHFLRLLRRHAA